MVLFRRWYAFAALGVVCDAGRRGRRPSLGAAPRSAGAKRSWPPCSALLSMLAYLSPAIVAWLPDPGAHDYATIYAAYRKPNAIFAAELFAWCGWGVPLGGGRSAPCRCSRVRPTGACSA